VDAPFQARENVGIVAVRDDRDAAERTVSDALIGATSIAGTPQYCREQVNAYRQSGIDVPI